MYMCIYICMYTLEFVPQLIPPATGVYVPNLWTEEIDHSKDSSPFPSLEVLLDMPINIYVQHTILNVLVVSHDQNKVATKEGRHEMFCLVKVQ